ncbi:hypothetical protein GALMADRAFT_250677 [Galerina marginata CBS 339.88]|uniref:SH3 domain-containing protein n=1 Tax=Galerina marginata (strain CBS 339.88) TaxID=685588 RepID=A0A067T233_GALM3|nr:hypothetical protein GALMADRAFT_250677 [Galerina marginata CBS 339.88]
MLPIDILGMVMIVHGEEFREDAPFGSALVKLGRAHCKIATLQEAFALTFKDTFLAAMERFKDEIKEYELLKKKLETRKAHYDSTSAKFDKLQNSKKEKDRREAEDEMERARQRYEETTEDLRAHMHAIQENEHHQLRELTAFLDLETNFVQSYLEVLKDVKSEWQDRADVKRSHSERDGHQRSFRSSKPPSRAATPKARDRDRVDSSTSQDSSDDGPSTPARIASGRHSRNDSAGSKTPSRPASRLSRKRTNSSAGDKDRKNGKGKEDDKDKDKEKEKEKPKDGDRSRRMSVAGWASSAVESVTGVGKNKKSKDKESFATLDDSDDDKMSRSRTSMSSADQSTEGGGSLRKSSSLRALARRKSKSSKENLSTNSSSSLPGTSSGFGSGAGAGNADSTPTGSRILKPPSLQDKKVVRALYDYTASKPDELSFRAGSDIVVVQEVLDDWWLGEMVGDGSKGLFPRSYVEVIGSTNAAAAGSGSGSLGGRGKPNVVQRLGSGVMAALFDKEKPPPAAAGLNLNGRNGGAHGQMESESSLEPYHHDHDHDHYGTSDADDEHIIRAVPMTANKSPTFFGGFDDSASFTSSMADTNSDDEFGRRFAAQPHSQMQPFSMAPPSPLHQQFDDSEDDGEKVWFPPQQQIQSQPFVPPPAPAPAPSAQPRRNTLKALDAAQQPLINRSISDNPAASSPMLLAPPNASPGTGASTPTKKIPPPPPPRRTVSHNPTASPPIPERKAPSFVSQTGSGSGSGHASNASLSGSISSFSAVASAGVHSSNAGAGAGAGLVRGGAQGHGYGYDRSPFESAVELDDGGGGAPQRCLQFRQNPFKPKGMCSNCLEFHD